MDHALDGPSSPARPHSISVGIPTKVTPPTSLSTLSYTTDRGRSTEAPPRVRPQSSTTQHSARERSPSDPYGLGELVGLVNLEDPTLGTERTIRHPRPGAQGTKGKWYIVRYGREVGVFNDWYVLHAVPGKI